MVMSFIRFIFKSAFYIFVIVFFMMIGYNIGYKTPKKDIKVEDKPRPSVPRKMQPGV